MKMVSPAGKPVTCKTFRAGLGKTLTISAVVVAKGWVSSVKINFTNKFFAKVLLVLWVMRKLIITSLPPCPSRFAVAWAGAPAETRLKDCVVEGVSPEREAKRIVGKAVVPLFTESLAAALKVKVRSAVEPLAVLSLIET